MFEYINDYHQLGEFQKELLVANEIYLDTETTGLDPFTDDLLLIQTKLRDRTFIFDCTLLEQKYINFIVQLIQDSHKPVIGHNIKFDIKFLKQKTGEMLTNIYDTFLTEVIITNGVGDHYPSLKDLVKKYAGVELNKDEQKNFIGNKEITNEKLIYASLDVEYLKDIFDKQQEKIVETKQQKVVDLEMRLIPAVVQMELNGVLLNKDKWEGLAKQAEEKSNILAKEFTDMLFERVSFEDYPNMYEAWKASGIKMPKTKKFEREMSSIVDPSFYKEKLKESFLVSSAKQVKSMLKLAGINVASTEEDYLLEYGIDDPLITKLIEFRGEFKKSSTSGENFIKVINPITNRIHGEFNQMGTRSGRFSSKNPNMQNIMSDEEYRSSFIAPQGKKFICADFSQEEYRLAGAISKEPAIIEAYKSGYDMHTKTASIVHNIPIEQVSKQQRQSAKTINFSILYGTTEFGMARKQKMSVDDAKKIINTFYSGYPILYTYQKVAKEIIENKLMSTTLTGRKRFFENKTFFTDTNAWKERSKYYSRVTREGFNHIIQGTGGDVIKIALCKLYYDNPFGEDKFKTILTVHDEIECEVDESIAEQAYDFVVHCMTSSLQPFLGEIPAVVEAKISNHWVH